MIFTFLVKASSMIKVDIVNEVSNTDGITKVKAEAAVEAVFDAMRMSMRRGERIELRGFGVFQVRKFEYLQVERYALGQVRTSKI